MGSPQERPGPLAEKRVEVSLGNGAIRIPFEFGRQPVTSDAMRARVDALLLAGARIIHPDWWNEYHLSEEDIREELEMEARHPEARAPYMVLGLVLSEEGFAKYDGPFKSFNDSNLRDDFRGIADTLIDNQFYNPAQIARAALFRPAMTYPDGQQKAWDAGELMSHLTIALAERGRTFNTSRDEHAPRISAHFRWPADLAEMLGIAYLLGEGKIEGDQLKSRVVERMRENLTSIADLARLSEEDQVRITDHANKLAGSEVLK